MQTILGQEYGGAGIELIWFPAILRYSNSGNVIMSVGSVLMEL
jgi:hypothetical protein